jgi:serine/threonine protein phosphatase PrpC
MRLVVGVATDIGKVREGNEDAYLVEPPLYAIADGMGGARGGEVASNLALETVEDLARAGKGTLAEQVREANRAVFARSKEDRAVTGMGTTLTAAKIVDEEVHLAHVGDSRAYLLRAGALRQLTDDHTLVNRMVKTGEITADEADVHPHRNVLTRALGTEPEVKVDVDEVPLMDGDRILLCSDGLFGMVSEEQIQAILEAEPDPQKAADRLIRAANRAGGIDNITSILIDVHEVAAGAGIAGSAAAHARPGRRWVKSAIGAAIALVLVLAGWATARRYIDEQWYVGVASEHVAIYQGVPAEPLGVGLSHVVVVTELPATSVEKLELYKTLPAGISADSLDGAQAIVSQMRKDLATSKSRAGSGTP